MLQMKFNVTVSSTRIMRERSGDSKGVGFARIEESKICDKIIQDLNNRPFPGFEANTFKQLLVKLADSGNNKKQRSNSGSNNNINNSSSLNLSSNGNASNNSASNINNISTNSVNNFSSHSLSTSANTSIHSANNQNSHFTSPTTNFNGFPIQIVDAQHNQLLVHHPHHQMIDPRMDPNAYLHHHPHSILRSIIPPSPFNTPHHGPNGIPYVIIQQPQLPHQLHLQQHHQQQQQHHQQQQQQQQQQISSSTNSTASQSSSTQGEQNTNNSSQSQLYPIQQQFANLSLSQNIPHHMIQQQVIK
jgi:hypothetical protein